LHLRLRLDERLWVATQDQSRSVSMSIRVLLSSKHKVVSEGIAAVLRTHPDIHLVGMADTDATTQALCAESDPMSC
jgi:hypothetical protein